MGGQWRPSIPLRCIEATVAATRPWSLVRGTDGARDTARCCKAHLQLAWSAKCGQSRLEIVKKVCSSSHRRNCACQSMDCTTINGHRHHASDAQTASERESCPVGRASQRKQPIHPWRIRSRHPCQERCEQRIDQGGGAASVASMQRSGIEGTRQAFGAREVASVGNTANPESPVQLGAMPEGVALQRERGVPRRPTQQRSRLCQTLPRSGSDFLNRNACVYRGWE